MVVQVPFLVVELARPACLESSLVLTAVRFVAKFLACYKLDSIVGKYTVQLCYTVSIVTNTNNQVNAESGVAAVHKWISTIKEHRERA